MVRIRLLPPSELSLAIQIDDDASSLFDTVGISFDALTPAHPFVRHTYARWEDAAAHNRAFLAIDDDGTPIAFAALARLPEGDALLEQLSVRRPFMRRGVGRALVQRALEWARQQEHAWLWLTTYMHVPWNRPYYERMGFHCVNEPECPRSVSEILEEERAALPQPTQRTAMRIDTRLST